MSADAIFVFAGRQSRKRFGVGLFREGYAPRLVLSVARFEWRRFPELGLSGDGGLVESVSATEPAFRYFFVDVRKDRILCERVQRGRLGTWSEATALADWVEREGIRTLAVVSDRRHLKRCLTALSGALRAPCTLVPLESPEESGERAPGRFAEAFKLLCYKMLSVPTRFRNRAPKTSLRQRPIPGIKGGFTLSQPGLQEGDFDCAAPLRLLPSRELRQERDPAVEADGSRRGLRDPRTV